MDLSGVTPQRAMHVHAPTCAGLHERLGRPLGKVHMGAADGSASGGKTGGIGGNPLEIEYWRGLLTRPSPPPPKYSCGSPSKQVLLPPSSKQAWLAEDLISNSACSKVFARSAPRY